MPKIKVNNVGLNYEEHGSGAETVVFGHGFGSSARKWQNLFELLPANYHCYALDLRGFGKSAAITENINPAQMADDLYQFSKEVGLGKFVYVGYSMGGRVGLDLAIAHSEVLKGAVLMVPVPARMSSEPLPPTEWRNPEAIQANYESILVRRQLTEEELQLLLEDNFLVKEATWLAAADWRKMYPDVEARLGEIKAPTLMIISGRETVLRPDDQWRTVRQIPGAKAVFFEDEGHLIIHENIRRLAREMIGFIDRLP